ncbi:MAG TPA: hypothetical protein VFX92_08560 [Candidatus Krumholzibacteria bacterium]|nr:hypothetical protein [Candidatus Krumholzibacteria bacterium]
MFAAAWRSALIIVAVLASAAGAETPMHQRKPVRLLSTLHAMYTMSQGDSKVGTETIDRRVYDDNRVELTSTQVTTTGGVPLTQESKLELDEESYFPRKFRSEKTLVQPTDTLRYVFTVDMYANVAVIGSESRGRGDSRQLVVPAGTAIVEVGAVYGWYEMMFWVDTTTEQRQRIQWLDPQAVRVEAGEIYKTGEEELAVLGKKIKVAVFKADRERVGEARVFIDGEGRIVRLEQNMTVYQLTEWSEDHGKTGDKR